MSMQSVEAAAVTKIGESDLIGHSHLELSLQERHARGLLFLAGESSVSSAWMPRRPEFIVAPPEENPLYSPYHLNAFMHTKIPQKGVAITLPASSNDHKTLVYGRLIFGDAESETGRVLLVPHAELASLIFVYQQGVVERKVNPSDTLDLIRRELLGIQLHNLKTDPVGFTRRLRERYLRPAA